MEQPNATTSAFPGTASRGATGSRHAVSIPQADQPPMHRGTDVALQHARAVIELLFGPPSARPMHVRYWESSVEHGRSDARFTLCLNRRGALRRMLLPPSELSIVESYLSGDVDIEGDFESATELADAIAVRLHSPRTLAALMRHLVALPRGEEAPPVHEARSEHSVEPVGKPHEAERDRAAIRYHYDVGNDFYQLWLDQRMVYSCAYFHRPHYSLDDAQRAKLDLVCRKLRLHPGERLLDVGCGWGALIMHAAEHYGVNALGITLSDAQAALARERIAAAGLSDRCRVEIRDYRALGDLRVDKISSVGMVEHVGVENLPTYFASLHRALVPGGLLLNHGIVSVDAAHHPSRFAWLESRLWKRNAFIEQYVFPDGKLGPLHAVIAAAEAEGFETRDAESLREHYALTLRAWVDRLAREKDRAIAIAGERVYRTWRLYMTASAHFFARGSINVVQTLFAKPDANGDAHLPMTREDILAGSFR
ncbi:MAG TPA: cyclopropane-fatty-acyl-phospholipid synthase family protein [Gemmatimonadaceae bacterium]|jgi:cyclopropane-fatty-acyl-phospholipid synthase